MSERLVESESDFFGDPRRREDELVPPLAASRWCGLKIDAPTRLDVDQVDRLPLVGILGSTTAEDRRRPLRTAALVVVTRVDARLTLCGPLFAPKRAPRRPPGPPDPRDGEDDEREGHGVEMFSADARGRLSEIPWRPGPLAMQVLLGDLASNVVHTTLERGAGATGADPDVQAFLAAHRPTPFPRPVWPMVDTPLPSYEPREDSPPIPARTGIALALERVNVIPAEPGQRATCIVRGSFRLPLGARDVVRPEPEPEPEPEPTPGAPEPGTAAAEALEERAALKALEDQLLGHVWRDVLDPDAKAVVPSTLVATGVTRPEPLVVPLQVPIYAPIDPANPPGEVTGHFALDLLRLRDGYRLLKQTNHLWAFSGDVVAGPFTTAVVAQRAIERP